ncbi:Pleckstrin y domain-containing H member 2 [Massospora cicadina]|nr:Pleckstrin y domain-containing H member 2 [Massospora cicadina]
MEASHPPTFSDLGGTVNNSPSDHRIKPSEEKDTLDQLRETEVVCAPKQRTLPHKLLTTLASPQGPDDSTLLLAYEALDDRTLPSSTVDPIIKLKIRYVARDLWQTVAFPTNITVAQARDICLLRCRLWLGSSKGLEPDQATDTPHTRLELFDDTSQLKPQSEASAVEGEPEYALFWYAAGHWLDDFRRLGSYALRHLDILELQARADFIFLQPAVYDEHYAEGHLYKLVGGISPGWKRRWFVLAGDQLSQFRRKREAVALSCANLSHPFQVQETSAGGSGGACGRETSLVLKFEAKCWWLRATSPEDFDHWRRILVTLHREVNDRCATLHPANSNVAHPVTSPAPSPHATIGKGSGGVRVKAGYMHCRAPITHAFRERYFVLRGKELSCYPSDRFDKNNPIGRTIPLHTAAMTTYEVGGKHYFRIFDKRAEVEGEGLYTDADRDGGGRSVLSTTRSLPARAARWARSDGYRLGAECLYVDSRSDWDAWRSAFETIAQINILTDPETKLETGLANSPTKPISPQYPPSTSVGSKFFGQKSLFGIRYGLPSNAAHPFKPVYRAVRLFRLSLPSPLISARLKARTAATQATDAASYREPPLNATTGALGRVELDALEDLSTLPLPSTRLRLLTRERAPNRFNTAFQTYGANAGSVRSNATLYPQRGSGIRGIPNLAHPASPAPASPPGFKSSVPAPELHGTSRLNRHNP